MRRATTLPVLILLLLCAVCHAAKNSERVKTTPSVHCSSVPGKSGVSGGLPSTWWSNTVENGSRIHLFSSTALAYLAPHQRHISATTPNPPPHSFFIFQQVPGGPSQIRTEDGFVLTCKEEGLVAVSLKGVLKEGEGIAGLQQVPGSPTDVHLSCPSSTQPASIRSSPSGDLSVGPGSGDQFSVLHIRDVVGFEGVTLGNWLVTEEWQDPDLYVRVADVVEGLKFRLVSAQTGEYIKSSVTPEHGIGMGSATPGPKNVLYLSKIIQWEGHWEAKVQIRASDFAFWTLLPDGKIGTVATPAKKGDRETFTLVKNRESRDEVMILASSGNFLTVEKGGGLRASVGEGNISTSHGSIDWNISPTVFRMEQIGAVRGEFQLHSGHVSGGEGGHSGATHRVTRVSREDFEYLASQGVNAVKIPIGYWLTMSVPPHPFPQDGAQLLDQAFGWARESGFRVYVVMYGGKGSQNGFESSGSRDGIADWAQNEKNVNDTVAAVDWVASRYGDDVAFGGISLLNEPLASRVDLETLKGYYERGYEAVRRHSACAFVGIQTRVGEGSDVNELNGFMREREYTNVVSEVSFFDPNLGGVEGEVSGVMEGEEGARKDMITNLEEGSGRPVVVGGWSLAMGRKRGKGVGYKEWGKGMKKALGHARGGKFFFSHSFERPEWEEFGFRSSKKKGWM